MRKSERYPGVTVEEDGLCLRIDFDPQNDLRVKGLYIWRPGKTTHELDDRFDNLSRAASRAIQKRALP